MPEALKRQIGPFPLWVWATIAGGTFLVVLLLKGRGTTQTQNQTQNSGESEDELPGSVGPAGPQGLTGEAGPPGEQGIQGEAGLQGEKGDVGERGQTGIQGIQGIQGLRGLQGIQGVAGQSAPKAPPRPSCDIRGWTPLYDPNTNKWMQHGIYVSKPTTTPTKGKEWGWDTVYCRWIQKDAGAKGPGLPTIDYSMGSEGGFSQMDVPAIALMMSDANVAHNEQIIPVPRIVENIPVMPHTPPRSLQRSNGRPFHG